MPARVAELRPGVVAIVVDFWREAPRGRTGLPICMAEEVERMRRWPRELVVGILRVKLWFPGALVKEHYRKPRPRSPWRGLGTPAPSAFDDAEEG